MNKKHRTNSKVTIDRVKNRDTVSNNTGTKNHLHP